MGLSLHPVLAQPAAARPQSEMEQAVESGERVEVLAERTEFSQVFADPSGRLVMESTVVPKRVRHADGSWSDTDLDLDERPDGTVRPGASIADVRFSGGGADAPMVTLVEDGKTLELSWPGRLPDPDVAGDSATYREVLPDVDLVLRATWTGFTHVLVVKTPEAAESVKAVTIDVGGDATVTRLPDGGLRAVAGRTVLATAGAPTMWDSAAMPAGVQARMATASVSATPAGPGDASNTAAVHTEVTTQGDLRLIPDAGMLDAPEQHFPLFIDPQWDKKPAKWAYATNNQSDNHHDRARVGWNPGSGNLHRSFFKFPTSDLAGKYVHSARVQMNLDHSWSCDFTPTSMWLSDAIGTGSSGGRVTWWTILRTGLVAASSHANDADGCGQKRHDMIVQFDNNGVKNQVQSFATGRKPDITFGFCACDLSGAMEGYAVRWKTFHAADAVLAVEYDSIPGTPERLMVEPNTDCSVPISTGTLTPRLYARLPDADTTQKLTATFQWKQISAAGQVNDGTYPVSTSTVANQSANAQSSPVQVTLQTGKRYAFRVQTKDPAPYNQSSPWSGWCEFYPDTTVPQEPAVTRTSAVPAPGGEAAFTISTPSLDVTKFRYGWKNPPDKEIAATLTTAADGTKSMTASVKLSTVKYGENIFTAYGIDKTLNNGRATSISLIVQRPSGPIAQYGLQAYPGVEQDTALQNGVNAANSLTATGLTWADDVRVLGGKTATFTGTATQGAVATGVALDTTKSYSVAAWVRLTDLTTTSTVIAKEAPAGASSPFRLRARPLTTGNVWCLLIPSTTATAGIEVCSTRLNTVNQWTHVAAGFDSADKRIKVWVDGVETSAGFSSPTTNTHPIVIGRGQDAAAAAAGTVERLRGNVADVQIFDRILVADDFTGATAVRTEDGEVDEPGILDPIEVGWWNFDDSISCFDDSDPSLCEVLANDRFERRLRTTLGTVIDYGRHGQSMFLDTDLADGTTPSTPTREFAQSQRNAGTGSAPDWQNASVLRTDQSFTVSAWVDPKEIGTGAHTVLSQDGPDRTPFALSHRPVTVNGVVSDYWTFSMMPAAGDGGDVVRSVAPITYDDAAGWTHLVAVYDASRKQLRLYVDGVLQGTTTNHMPVWAASGPLTVGAALFSGVRTDRWHGGIDDVRAYHGALNDAHVRDLYSSEVLEMTA